MKPLRWLDDWLNNITMYRLLLYGLGILVAIAVVFCFTGTLTLSGNGLLLSTVILLAVCYGANKLLGKLFDAPTNSESSLITALILVCILPQATTVSKALYIGLAGLLAVASKYIVAWRHKHLFNPAAFGALLVGLFGLIYANWWIGNPTMLPFVLILGLLIVKKIRRFPLVIAFAIAALGLGIIVGVNHGQVFGQNLHNIVMSGPLVFFGTIMLTEPSTTPPTRYYQLLYGVLVGILFSSQLHFRTLYASPQTALILGNLFAWGVSYKARLRLKLKTKHQISAQVFDYVFAPDRPLRFMPGQYMEWTLPHHGVDGRGNRRTFTIASSPTENEVHLGIKFYEPSSSFKRRLAAMKPGDTMTAGMVAGDFLLSADKNAKFVWIAGGIGITPFRSMATYLTHTQEKRDIALIYQVSNPDELAYREIFEHAQANGLKLIPLLGAKEIPPDWKGHTGYVTPELLKQEVPDFKQRRYYISGPNAMVQNYKRMLRQAGVPMSHIVTDYFSGY